jgi:hypothetical protein
MPGKPFRASLCRRPKTPRRSVSAPKNGAVPKNSVGHGPQGGVSWKPIARCGCGLLFNSSCCSTAFGIATRARRQPKPKSNVADGRVPLPTATAQLSEDHDEDMSIHARAAATQHAAFVGEADALVDVQVIDCERASMGWRLAATSWKRTRLKRGGNSHEQPTSYLLPAVRRNWALNHRSVLLVWWNERRCPLHGLPVCLFKIWPARWARIASKPQCREVGGRNRHQRCCTHPRNKAQ